MSLAGAVGPYTIKESIGSGGMGEVYRARDERLHRDVALKILSGDSEVSASSVARFEREARSLAALSHPNIIAVYDCGFDSGTFYIATELLEGETLRSWLGSDALAWRRALQVALPIADALRSAHERGIVHRDLKPENVFITRTGQVKVLDFGLARSHFETAPESDTLTRPGSAVGTPAYMAPEQLRCETVGPQADVFAFGCVLYEMLSGRRAFHGASVAETSAAVLKDSPEDLRKISRDVPEQLVRLVEHCLEKDPAVRIQSFADLVLALEDVEPSAADRGTVETKRLRAVATSAPAALLVALVALGIYLGSRKPAASDATTQPARATSPASEQVKASAAPVNPEAHKLYMEGRYRWERRTPDALLQAIEFFRRSIAIDPTYAPAYIGTADCYMLLGGTYEYLPPRVAMPKAREAAVKALALEPSLAAAHATLANIHHEYDWDWEAAEREFKRAIELDPKYPIAHHWYGQALVLRGKHEEGLRELKTAEQLDPLLFAAQTDFVQAFWIAGDNATAIARARRVIEVEPRFWLAHWLLGLALLSDGDTSGAIDSLQRAVALGGTPATRGTLATALAQAGRTADARRVIAELESLRRSGKQYVSPAGFVVAYAALGDFDRAYQEAERGLEERASLVTSLNSAPIAAPFRSDPRYSSFARRVGLPPLP